ncbi:MAG: hypothetical protein Q8Q26_12400, partial [Pseudorhodobacter sp.]|nr:hypothetical protein [Pseudorhodobacter sp.]
MSARRNCSDVTKSTSTEARNPKSVISALPSAISGTEKLSCGQPMLCNKLSASPFEDEGVIITSERLIPLSPGFQDVVFEPCGGSDVPLMFLHARPLVIRSSHVTPGVRGT